MNYLIVLLLLAFGTTGISLAEDVEDNRRIIRGKLQAALPFYVQLKVILAKGFAQCGASLLTPYGAVSAGHCLDGGKSITAYFGSKNKFEGMQRRVKSWQVHPKYHLNPTYHDVSVVVWKEAITWTEQISPITIGPNPKPGTKAMVAGIGEIAEKATTIFLRSAQVTIATEEICRQKTFNREKFFEMQPKNSFICTYDKPFKGCYFGDSGGPLYLNEGKPILLGIISGGPPNMTQCKDGATVLPSASYYSQWIQDSIACLVKSQQENAQRKCVIS